MTLLMQIALVLIAVLTVVAIVAGWGEGGSNQNATMWWDDE